MGARVISYFNSSCSDNSKVWAGGKGGLERNTQNGKSLFSKQKVCHVQSHNRHFWPAEEVAAVMPVCTYTMLQDMLECTKTKFILKRKNITLLFKHLYFLCLRY